MMKRYAFLFLMLLFAARMQAQISAEFETDTLTSNMFVASSFITDNEGWLADDAGMLWHTNNSGTSWTSSAIEKYFLKIHFTDALNGFGITANAAYKTSNGGASWSALTLPGAIGRSLYFRDSNTGFISGAESIYKTTDGGNTWSTISAGEGMYFLDYCFINSSAGIAAVYDADSTRSILRTTNGGSTWNQVYATEDFFILAVWMTNENTAWAAGYYSSTARGNYPAIIRSNDGGQTWENSYLNRETGSRKGERFIDVRFRNELEGFALSAYTESIYTTDGGETWNSLYDESGTCFIPDWGIYQALDGVSKMYLIGKQGYVTKWK